MPNFANFAKFLRKTEILEKFKLPNKRGFELMEKRIQDSCPAANPIPKLSMTSMVWNISIGQLGYLSGYAPSQVLHT